MTGKGEKTNNKTPPDGRLKIRARASALAQRMPARASALAGKSEAYGFAVMICRACALPDLRSRSRPLRSVAKQPVAPTRYAGRATRFGTPACTLLPLRGRYAPALLCSGSEDQANHRRKCHADNHQKTMRGSAPHPGSSPKIRGDHAKSKTHHDRPCGSRTDH
ncbi:MAG: hypothetical protein [Microviridae sp.]|nr:MAG: hypothetical protein [Microviridae sp.]